MGFSRENGKIRVQQHHFWWQFSISLHKGFLVQFCSIMIAKKITRHIEFIHEAHIITCPNSVHTLWAIYHEMLFTWIINGKYYHLNTIRNESFWLLFATLRVGGLGAAKLSLEQKCKGKIEMGSLAGLVCCEKRAFVHEKGVCAKLESSANEINIS